MLRELRDRGLTLAICSNWDWDLEPAVAETGLDGWFDTLVSSAWAGARKPHPRIYRYLLDQTGLDPAEILFVGDTWGPDVVGPLAAGMTPAYLERDGHWPDVDATGRHLRRRGRAPARSRAGCSRCWKRTDRARRSSVASDDADVLGLFALAAGADVELDRLPLLQGAVARCPGWPRSGRTRRARPHGR